MSGLAIVAAGGLAREVLAVERAAGRYSTFLLLDDDPALWGRDVEGIRVLGGPGLVAELSGYDVLVCAGRGETRRSLVGRLTAAGVEPDRHTSCIHPRVVVPPGCSVGPGNVLLAGVVMTTGVRLGAHVVAMPHVTLTHDDVVEDFATLCAGVSLGGNVTVGVGAYLGMNAAVRERVVVGDGAVLGMGAALVHDLPAGETWAGVPARPVRRPEEAHA